MSPSCALLGRFAIGVRVALLWQHITRTRNASEYMLVLALCLVIIIIIIIISIMRPTNFPSR